MTVDCSDDRVEWMLSVIVDGSSDRRRVESSDGRVLVNGSGGRRLMDGISVAAMPERVRDDYADNYQFPEASLSCSHYRHDTAMYLPDLSNWPLLWHSVTG